MLYNDLGNKQKPETSLGLPLLWQFLLNIFYSLSVYCSRRCCAKMLTKDDRWQ